MKVKGTTIKASVSFTIVKWLFFVIFIIYGFSLVFPFLWMLMNTFKSNAEFIKDSFAWPTDPSNFVTNWNSAMSLEARNSGVAIMFWRTIWESVVREVVGMAVVLGLSYVTARYKFPGRQFFIMLGFGMIFVPGGSLAATYNLIVKLNLLNNPLVLILMGSGGVGLSYMIMYAAFRGLDNAYFESARIDGANEVRLMTQIALPMILPNTIPVIMLDFIGIWNDYYGPYMYTRDKPTLAVGIQMLVDQENFNPNTVALFILMILSILPVLILFIAFQKPIMENVSAGGIKG